ncbi:MAG TPA: helix-turn-helix domain-containing protein [Candidatus Acidoferrales bacterium]|nr:helix-turn-helix domain-containing protein [Candidatus Acidoferrales bacterium]
MDNFDKIIDYLKQLDLSDVEAKLYLTLLQAGPTSVRDLAETIDIKRTTTYFYIDQLIEKGLILKLVKGSKKLVSAEEPENLKILVEEKLKKAKSVQKGFPAILNTLKSSLPQETTNTDADIKYYKGKNGVKKIYVEALKAEELRSYVNVAEVAKAFPNNYLLLDRAYKSNPKINIFEICEESPITRERLKLTNKNHSYKVLPEHMKLTSQDVLIYDNRVAIIDLKGATNGIVLHSLDLSKNFKLLFDFLWDVLPG